MAADTAVGNETAPFCSLCVCGDHHGNRRGRAKTRLNGSEARRFGTYRTERPIRNFIRVEVVDPRA